MMNLLQVELNGINGSVLRGNRNLSNACQVQQVIVDYGLGNIHDSPGMNPGKKDPHLRLIGLYSRRAVTNPDQTFMVSLRQWKMKDLYFGLSRFNGTFKSRWNIDGLASGKLLVEYT